MVIIASPQFQHCVAFGKVSEGYPQYPNTPRHPNTQLTKCIMNVAMDRGRNHRFTSEIERWVQCAFCQMRTHLPVKAQMTDDSIFGSRIRLNPSHGVMQKYIRLKSITECKWKGHQEAHYFCILIKMEYLNLNKRKGEVHWGTTYHNQNSYHQENKPQELERWLTGSKHLMCKHKGLNSNSPKLT